MQHAVDEAPVAEPGEFVDVGEFRQLLARPPQLAVAVAQRARQVAQFLGDMLALPVQGNHIAERAVDLVAHVHEQRTESQQGAPDHQVIGLHLVVRKTPPGDGKQRGEYVGKKILANGSGEAQRERDDHHDQQQQNVLHRHRHMLGRENIQPGPHRPCQRRADHHLPVDPLRRRLVFALKQRVAHQQGAQQQQHQKQHRTQQRQGEIQVRPEQRKRRQYAHQVHADSGDAAILHQHLQLGGEQLIMGDAALVYHGQILHWEPPPAADCWPS